MNKRLKQIFDDYSLEVEEVEELIQAMHAKGRTEVTVADYAQWMFGEGRGGDHKRFDAAVVSIVGQQARDNAELLARLDNLLWYKLGKGPKIVGGINLASL